MINVIDYIKVINYNIRRDILFNLSEWYSSHLLQAIRILSVLTIFYSTETWFFREKRDTVTIKVLQYAKQYHHYGIIMKRISLRKTIST